MGANREGSNPYIFCREMTVAEVCDIENIPQDRRVLLELADGDAPTGLLVKARVQRQVLEDGQLRWKPDR